MMGMMQMHMGCMQMMMGAGMMNGGVTDAGVGTQNITPEATTAAPEVTATVEITATGAASETMESNEAQTDVNNSTSPAPAIAVTLQKATAGAVNIGAVPLAGEEPLDIDFAITLDTHSVELNYDLAELATLTIGEASFSAISWTPNAPDGHHVAGVLRFTIDPPARAELAEANEVTLELRDIDGEQVTLHFAVSEP
jgi:hypothetical protein